jgi:hypothetical protein
MIDPYLLPILKDAEGAPVRGCGENLTVTAKVSGKNKDGIVDVYSPDYWNVVKGKKLAKKMEVKTTDIHCIEHLRDMAHENNWVAFEMRSDGTTVFYSRTSGLE